MKPVAFDYVRSDSVGEAADILLQRGLDARVIAGGQSLMPMLNMRLARPVVLVDIACLPELRSISSANGYLSVGAATTQAELQAFPALSRLTPLLAVALSHVGHFQTRNRGTVCGSLCHADPSAEIPLCLAVLDGTVVLRRGETTRRLSAREFQTGLLSTACEPGDLVVEARFPIARLGERHVFREVARRHGDFAIASFAAIGSGDRVRLGVGGVMDRPVVREWTGLKPEDVDDALNDFAWDLEGSDDIHATASYRRGLVRRVGKTVISEACAWRS